MRLFDQVTSRIMVLPKAKQLIWQKVASFAVLLMKDKLSSADWGALAQLMRFETRMDIMHAVMRDIDYDARSCDALWQDDALAARSSSLQEPPMLDGVECWSSKAAKPHPDVRKRLFGSAQEQKSESESDSSGSRSDSMSRSPAPRKKRSRKGAKRDRGERDRSDKGKRGHGKRRHRDKSERRDKEKRSGRKRRRGDRDERRSSRDERDRKRRRGHESKRHRDGDADTRNEEPSASAGGHGEDAHSVSGDSDS